MVKSINKITIYTERWVETKNRISTLLLTRERRLNKRKFKFDKMQEKK